MIADARALLARADRCVILTGAGISAESGVPTFRGDGGLWKSFRAENLATPGAFAGDPRLVWEWYGWRREVVRQCTPNAAHRALARLALQRSGVTLATQNVDGLHADAARLESGESANRDRNDATLIELHGSLFRVRCTRCVWRATRRDPIDASSVETLPRCDNCSALARPDIVWFGESLDEAALERAFADAAAASVCLVVGTSAVVQPAASLAMITREAGGAIIEVNPEDTPLTSLATIAIRGTAVATIPSIVSL